jgi:hypothetical protein
LAEWEAGGVSPPASLEEMTTQHRVVFVLHSEDLAGTLEPFASEKDRLVNAVPGKGRLRKRQGHRVYQRLVTD